MRAVSFAILALGLIIGAGCSPTSRRDGTDVGEGESAVTRESQATDVEAVLKRGKWQSRPGGVAWQFADGGKVYIHDGSGDVDESYRWEVTGRNESKRKIEIKFWKPGSNEHRIWTFAFGADGEPANVESFTYKGIAIVDSDEFVRYPID